MIRIDIGLEFEEEEPYRWTGEYRPSMPAKDKVRQRTPPTTPLPPQIDKEGITRQQQRIASLVGMILALATLIPLSWVFLKEDKRDNRPQHTTRLHTSHQKE